MPIPNGMHTGSPAIDAAAIESSILGVLIDAETAREGATALLGALAPALDDGQHGRDSASVALAVREREGLTLHVLAELGAQRTWPSALEPRFALSGQSGIDPGTEAMIIPLRANGRVVGALLFGEAGQASALMRDTTTAALLDTAAAVLEALLVRTQAVLSRRGIALRSVETIIDGMAHQMANPLTGASAIAQLLAEEIQDPGQRAAVKQISQELTRAFVVLQDMLSFHAETGAHAGVLDLNSIVEGITRFRGYAIREQGITLHVEPTTDTAPVRADARGLEHALLIALRFAEVQSRGSVNRSIAVRVVEREPSELVVEITDSGPGNIPELTAGYFDLRFREEHAARTALADTPDLGLVDNLLRASGGRLEVHGSKADGTTLNLIVPRAATGNHPVQSKAT
jgi:signal transduction histidine kinase